MPNAPAPPLAIADAPGKVILVGEHAVVYGQPAIAVPVASVAARAAVHAAEPPLRIVAEFPPGEERDALEIDLATARHGGALAAAADAALRHAGRTAQTPWSIEITSTVPTGRGMGSSAAVAVALVRAIGEAAGEAWDAATVAALAMASEEQIHGTPSGIDNTVIAFGQPIRFQRGQVRPLTVGGPLHLLIADSGTSGATRDMVTGVRARRDARPTAYDDWLRRSGRLVDEAAAAIADGNPSRLGWLMNTNHLILQAMRVSTPALDSLVAAARESGAFGAKLSGAGGGGVAIALVKPEAAADVESALRHAGAAAVIRTTVEPITGSP